MGKKSKIEVPERKKSISPMRHYMLLHISCLTDQTTSYEIQIFLFFFSYDCRNIEPRVTFRVEILYSAFNSNSAENTQNPMRRRKRDLLDKNNQGNLEVLRKFYEKDSLFNLRMEFYIFSAG